MDKKEIEHKLEQAKTDRDLAIMEANKEIERLKAQLAEAEKPKPLKPLEHGDYGISKVGPTSPYLAIECKDYNREIEPYYENKGCDGCNYAKEHPEHYTKLGNIFDDLKAQSEPLEEFKITSKKCNGKIKVQLKSHDSNNVTQPFGTTPDTIIWFEGRFGYFELDELHEIILKLRRMEATAKSK